MNKLSEHLNKSLEGKNRNKWSSYGKDPIMDLIFKMGHSSDFMAKTDKFAARLEAERIEMENNSWLKEKDMR